MRGAERGRKCSRAPPYILTPFMTLGERSEKLAQNDHPQPEPGGLYAVMTLGATPGFIGIPLPLPTAAGLKAYCRPEVARQLGPADKAPEAGSATHCRPCCAVVEFCAESGSQPWARRVRLLLLGANRKAGNIIGSSTTAPTWPHASRRLPLWRRCGTAWSGRLGLLLSEIAITRLAVLAFLHDAGKLHPGFQAKGWPLGAWKGPLHGHVAEGVFLFSRSGAREPF